MSNYIRSQKNKVRVSDLTNTGKTVKKTLKYSGIKVENSGKKHAETQI